MPVKGKYVELKGEIQKLEEQVRDKKREVKLLATIIYKRRGHSKKE